MFCLAQTRDSFFRFKIQTRPTFYRHVTGFIVSKGTYQNKCACFRCVCVSGLVASDGMSCLNDSSFLVVSGKKKIGFSAISPLRRPPAFSTITRRRSSVVDLDVDYDSKLIYFADAKKDIKSVFLNGTGLKVVVSGML